MSGFFDAREGSLPKVISSNVCVVGSGAAGITLARELAKTIPDVVLVEAGNLDIEGRTQNLYQGRNLGLPYFGLASCRLRYFGGTTNHWTGYCRANDRVDYEGRDDVGLPAWPFGYDELQPYVTRAASSLGISGNSLDPHTLVANRGADPGTVIGGDGSPLETKVFQLAKDIRLGSIYRDDLDKLENLRTVLNLNITHVQLSQDGNQVKHLDGKTIDGKKYKVEARQFILCCHAIENARLLMVSNDVMAPGVGNAYDHVGRYFMDHIHVDASRFIPSETFPAIYNWDYAQKLNLNANLGFSDEYHRENGLLQYYCRFSPRYFDDPAVGDAYRNVKRGLYDPGDLDFLADIAKATTEIGNVAKYEMAEKNIRYVQPAYYEMGHRLEQAPNPDSRVVVSDRRDALDSLIADLDWRVNETDIRTFKEGQAAIGRELAALGYGRIIEEDMTRELVEDRITGHYHHIGTTKMSTDPTEGVVDKFQKVHGVSNLYIGGSSVFPTAGYSGPTMMIIAMSMRLADHLKAEVL